MKLILVDRTSLGTQFDKYNNDPHLIQPVIHKTDKAKLLLDNIINISNERLATIHKEQEQDFSCFCARKYNEKYPGKMPPIIVVIDEIADILNEDEDLSLKFIQIFQKLTKARDIFFIIGASTAGGDVFWKDKLLQANLCANIIFLHPSYPDEYRDYDESWNMVDFSDPTEGLAYYFNVREAPQKIIIHQDHSS